MSEAGAPMAMGDPKPVPPKASCPPSAGYAQSLHPSLALRSTPINKVHRCGLSGRGPVAPLEELLNTLQPSTIWRREGRQIPRQGGDVARRAKAPHEQAAPAEPATSAVHTGAGALVAMRNLRDETRTSKTQWRGKLARRKGSSAGARNFVPAKPKTTASGERRTSS